MSIFPATDIVADVAQAADPAKVRTEMKRLSQLSQGANASGDGFATTLNEASNRSGDVRTKSSQAIALSHTGSTIVNHGKSEGARMSDTAQKFEAYLLQSFLEVLLPKEDHDTYGQGVSGGIWRSMMAEQLGAQLAKRGVIGLDKIFERQFGAQDIATNAQAPRAETATGA